MVAFVNVGFGNIVNASRIIAMISPDSAPGKRLVQTAKDAGRAIDATQGRRTRAVVVMDDGHILLSALLPETISSRWESRQNPAETEPLRMPETDGAARRQD